MRPAGVAAEEKVVLGGQAVGKTFPPDTIEMKPDVRPKSIAPADTIEPDPEPVANHDVIKVPWFVHSPDRPTHKSWSRYCDWRMTKCPSSGERPPMDEVNQATHELLGELGELSELISEKTHQCFLFDELRNKLIDEAGDCFFCGAWALDAWGFSLLRAVGAQKTVSVCADQSRELDLYARCREHMVIGESTGEEPWRPSREFMAMAHLWDFHAVGYCCSALTTAALTSNAIKKILYQGRAQDNVLQAQRVYMSLISVENLLTIAGATVEDALRRNIEKLDARFPGGWKPGGGNRTGAGA